MKLMQSTSHFVQVIIGTSLYFQELKEGQLLEQEVPQFKQVHQNRHL